VDDDVEFRRRAAAKTILAIADDPDGVTLGTVVAGALDLGRDCTVNDGLHLGSTIGEDVSNSPVAHLAFASLNLSVPASGLLSDYCIALRDELARR
jgi:hypothetical protein